MCCSAAEKKKKRFICKLYFNQNWSNVLHADPESLQAFSLLIEVRSGRTVCRHLSAISHSSTNSKNATQLSHCPSYPKATWSKCRWFSLNIKWFRIRYKKIISHCKTSEILSRNQSNRGYALLLLYLRTIYESMYVYHWADWMEK